MAAANRCISVSRSATISVLSARGPASGWNAFRIERGADFGIRVGGALGIGRVPHGDLHLLKGFKDSDVVVAAAEQRNDLFGERHRQKLAKMRPLRNASKSVRVFRLWRDELAHKSRAMAVPDQEREAPR